MTEKEKTGSDQQAVDAAVDRLNELLDKQEITIFTPEEALILKEMAKAWQAARGFVYISKMAGSTLKWVVIMGGIWVAFKTGLFGWLKGGLN